MNFRSSFELDFVCCLFRAGFHINGLFDFDSRGVSWNRIENKMPNVGVRQ